MKQRLNALALNGQLVDIETELGLIKKIGPCGSLDEAKDADSIDFDGAFVFPGFTDLQINGSFGHDFALNPKSIWDVAGELPRYGVCAFLPTIVTASNATIDSALRAIEDGPPNGFIGALPLGIHAEGPFLSASKKGAHDESLMQEPSERPSWLFSPTLKMVTLAPELPGSNELIEELVAAGVLVSAGHTMATSEAIQDAASRGLKYGTHLFNAMSGLDHRNPGAAAALLENDSITCGLIVDGIHVHRQMVRLAWKLKSRHKLSLVTDAVAAAGMPEGHYTLSGFDVQVKNGAVRLEDGTLAGSALTMDQALKNLKTITGCSWAHAVHTITCTPAHLLGLPQPIIAENEPATLTCLSDEGTILFTMIDGAIAFQTQ